MNPSYSPSTVERWVSDLFIQAGILSPTQLLPERISEAFGIDYSLWNGSALSYRSEDGKQFYILENKASSRSERKQHFLHELCHALRHVGDQRKMVETFRQRQEWDAKLFVLYAAVPYHMINCTRNYSIQDLAAEFDVSKELAWQRIEDIRVKNYWDEKLRFETMVCESPAPAYNLSEKSTETQRIMYQLKNQLERKGEKLEIKSLL
ncbi:MAG: ImmA/IrrE family metallo-endopeptidase [Sporolactobacillus sp.]